MISSKIGIVIRQLRIAEGLTQKELADQMNISHKTVSKWECGLGCPDLSLIGELSSLLKIDIQSLLAGEIVSSDTVGGNMKKTKYYVCPTCHNITLCTGAAEVSCCGKKLVAEEMKKAEMKDQLSVEIIEDDWHVTSDHSMTKKHYISFVAFATGEKLQLIKQYPEWNLDVRIQKRGHGMLMWYCVEHGLFYQLL